MKKNKLYLLLLLAVGLLPLASFFKPGLPITHDGQDHVARIANFYQSLSEGNLVPRWAANLNWGYGHPILMFLYPLPSYIASFFHILSFSLVDSTKIVFGLSFVLSGVFMYLWIAEIWGNQSALIAGLIYMFAPYRFVDLYVRGALGECWAFVWPPLICYFALKLSKKPSWLNLAGGSLSLAALILSHNALSLMFLPIILAYMGHLVLSSKKKWLILNSCFLLLMFGFALSFFFWFPALIEGKYTLRDIVTKNQIVGFEPLRRLLWSGWDFGGTGTFSVQLGPLQWSAIFLAPLIIRRFYRMKKHVWILLTFLLIYFCLTIFLILPAARPLYLGFALLQKFQFAWRWLSAAIFMPAIFASALVFLLPKRLKFLCSMFFVLCSLFLNKNYWQAKDYLHQPESFYTQPYASPTDTGESAPIWSVRFMEKFPKVRYEVIEGKVKIEEISRTTTRHVFEVEATEPSRIVDNTLYFPNWQVFVSAKGGPASGRDGQPAPVEFQDPNYRGLMTFNVPAGSHQVEVIFRDTKLRRLAEFISLVSVVTIIIGFGVVKLNQKR
jgi:uncharacterized membrane protein